MGAFNRNLGDSVATQAQKKHFDDVVWTNYDIIEPPKRVWKTEDINKFDALWIGGGGLIEERGYLNRESKYKIPLTEKNLEGIRVPIIVFAIGFNEFRGITGIYNSFARRNLQALINQANVFSVRNDGSLEKLSNYLPDTSKIIEVPDPALLERAKGVFKKCGKGVLGVASNNNRAINLGRKINHTDIQTLVDKHSLDILGHTKKDFKWKGEHALSLGHLQKSLFDYKLLEKYQAYDYCVAMRGHSQLYSYGCGTPCITLSTQDKLYDFCNKHDLLDYCVDTAKDKDWREKLAHQVEQIKNPKAWILKNNELRVRWLIQYFSLIERIKNELSLL